MDAAAAMFGGSDQDRTALAALGMSGDLADRVLKSDAIEIWPENWTAVMVFMDMQTQWVVGMNGPVGLRYEALDRPLRAHGVTPETESAIFAQIRILERGALEAMSRG